MSDLLVLVPSRGRPGAVDELAAAFAEMCTADTLLVFVVDTDDPRAAEYEAASTLRARVLFTPSATMVEALNFAAVGLSASALPFAVAFMGDDHRPRTRGWDTRYLEALRRLGTGIVYGDDLIQGERLPTQVAMTADIVRALGWMAPPVLRHMYVDNFWRDLGVHAGCLRYLPDVVVEHLHPVAGKAAMDAGYTRVNAPEVYDADAVAYREFGASGAFRSAVDAVRGLYPADPRRERLIGMARASLVAEAVYLTGGRTIADIAAQPTDLGYLMGAAVQVRSQAEPLEADVVCVTGLDDPGPALAAAGRAAVVAGAPVETLAAAGLTLLRYRTVGEYPVALGVRP